MHIGFTGEGEVYIPPERWKGNGELTLHCEFSLYDVFAFDELHQGEAHLQRS